MGADLNHCVFYSTSRSTSAGPYAELPPTFRELPRPLFFTQGGAAEQFNDQIRIRNLFRTPSLTDHEPVQFSSNKQHHPHLPSRCD